MATTSKHILIVGTGSVGKRHGRNLAALGCSISCVDPQQHRLDEFAGELELAGNYADMEAAMMQAAAFDGVVIASPPAFHVDQTIQALQAGLPVLLEKPVSPDQQSAERLLKAERDSGVPVLLGYTWRWWAPFEKVRELLAAKAVGELRHVRFVMGAHLADWHPWEAYQDFFMASREQGGGALLDESHWLDLMVWFFGMPKGIFARVEKISDLEISTDDNVDMILDYPGGMRVSMHLDLYSRPHEKYIRFIGEKGTLLWTVDPNRVAVSSSMEEQWDFTEYDCERNTMFEAVAAAFLRLLDGDSNRLCTLTEGVDVLKLVELARRSHSSGRHLSVV